MLIGYANALSRKYLENEEQINANTKTTIKQSSDVKLSLQLNGCANHTSASNDHNNYVNGR